MKNLVKIKIFTSAYTRGGASFRFRVVTLDLEFYLYIVFFDSVLKMSLHVIVL